MTLGPSGRLSSNSTPADGGPNRDAYCNPDRFIGFCLCKAD